MRWWSRRTDDEGSASLEFITAGLVLLVPIVYLVLALSAIQGAALAVEGASRQAARVYTLSATTEAAEAAATAAIAVALADYGLESDAAHVSIECAPDPDACLSRQGLVTVSVAARVPLPLVPAVLDVDAPLAVPLSASATSQVSRFAGEEAQ